MDGNGQRSADLDAVVAREELFIGIVGAMGTNLDGAQNILAEALETYGYATKVIRISDIIREFPRYARYDKRHVRDYYDRMIAGGNYICESLKDPSALARLVTMAIRRKRDALRDERLEGHHQGKPRNAFIVHSLKRPDEIRRLREVYGSLYYTIAIFADKSAREERMTRKINDELGDASLLEGRLDAQRLLEKDERQKTKWGQRVSDTFAEADYFVRRDDDQDLRAGLGRFLSLVFDTPYISPTRGEVAMMHAYSAGLRSVDLSRQIGAVIVARDGRVLTTGCNEVPRPGGGQYWGDDKDDARDFVVGRDINDVKKRDTVVELLSRLDSTLKEDQTLDGFGRMYDELDSIGTFSGTRADSLIEFGRASHAEMSALNGALLETISIRDADLYTTTFPCHMCTRLIIGAGIRNVFYIEPYPKSAALELYGISEITVNPPLNRNDYQRRLRAERVEDKKVHFLPFDGVAPRRYSDLFVSMKKRKNDDGTRLGFVRSTAKPRRAPAELPVHRFIEKHVADRIEESTETLRQERNDEPDALTTPVDSFHEDNHTAILSRIEGEGGPP